MASVKTSSHSPQVTRLQPRTFSHSQSSLGFYQDSFLQLEVIRPLPRLLPTARSHSVSAMTSAHSPKSFSLCQVPSRSPKSFGFCQDFFPQPDVIPPPPGFLPTARSHSATTKTSDSPKSFGSCQDFFPACSHWASAEIYSHSPISFGFRQDFLAHHEVTRFLPRPLGTPRSDSASAKTSWLTTK